MDAITNPAEIPRGTGQRVLLVEDDERALEALAGLLTMLGYNVTAVATAEDAGRLPVEPPFELLLTDVILPGASGVDLARGLRARWRGLRVLLMSGYTERETSALGIDRRSTRLLHKPLDMATLAREVAAVLQERV
jgi:DNA-binding response OmpR family regulator